MSISQIIIKSTGNNEYLYRYHILKRNLTKENFTEFMKALGFDEDKVCEEFFENYEMDQHHEEIKGEEKDFTKKQDEIFCIKNKEFDVEVVCFSKEELRLMIRTNKKDKFLKIANKFFRFQNEQ